MKPRAPFHIVPGMIHIPWICGAASSSSFASLTLFIFPGSYHWGHSLHDLPFRWNDSGQAAHPVLSSAEKKKGKGIPNPDISVLFSVSHDSAASLPRHQAPGQALQRRNSGSLGQVPSLPCKVKVLLWAEDQEAGQEEEAAGWEFSPTASR